MDRAWTRLRLEAPTSQEQVILLKDIVYKGFEYFLMAKQWQNAQVAQNQTQIPIRRQSDSRSVGQARHCRRDHPKTIPGISRNVQRGGSGDRGSHGRGERGILTSGEAHLIRKDSARLIQVWFGIASARCSQR